VPALALFLLFELHRLAGIAAQQSLFLAEHHVATNQSLANLTNIKLRMCVRGGGRGSESLLVRTHSHSHIRIYLSIHLLTLAYLLNLLCVSGWVAGLIGMMDANGDHQVNIDEFISAFTDVSMSRRA
jgi:hypothetical protein